MEIRKVHRIKRIVTVLLACLMLAGCSNEGQSAFRTYVSDMPAEASAENKPASARLVSSAVDKSNLRAIAYNGSNVYVAVGSMGKIFTSTDGLSWTARESGINKALQGVAWGEKQFVAAGDEGTLLTSKDGISWKHADSGVNTALLRVMWDGQKYIAFGDGTVITSANGTAWNAEEVPKIVRNNGMEEKISYDIADILWDGNQYIAAGSGNFILTSASLDAWDVRVPHSLGTGMFCDLAWNGNRYVAVGDHLAMMTSPDGHRWTNEGCKMNGIESVDDAYTLCLWSVVWGRDKFIAVGHRGLILTAADGLDWSVIPPVTRASLHRVLWDGEKYIAVGDNETVITSADGVNWTKENM